MTPDMVNACFELFGAVFNSLNVIQIRKDKAVKGVHVIPTIVFTIWAAWNVYYYGYLEQPYSVAAAVVLGIVNGTWVYYYFKYSPRQKSLNRLKDFYRNKQRTIK